MTSEDIELITKGSAEVVAALADRSGALAIPREYATYAAASVAAMSMGTWNRRAMRSLRSSIR